MPGAKSQKTVKTRDTTSGQNALDVAVLESSSSGVSNPLTSNLDGASTYKGVNFVDGSSA